MRQWMGRPTRRAQGRELRDMPVRQAKHGLELEAHGGGRWGPRASPPRPRRRRRAGPRGAAAAAGRGGLQAGAGARGRPSPRAAAARSSRAPRRDDDVGVAGSLGLPEARGLHEARPGGRRAAFMSPMSSRGPPGSDAARRVKSTRSRKRTTARGQDAGSTAAPRVHGVDGRGGEEVHEDGGGLGAHGLEGAPHGLQQQGGGGHSAPPPPRACGRSATRLVCALGVLVEQVGARGDGARGEDRGERQEQDGHAGAPAAAAAALGGTLAAALHVQTTATQSEARVARASAVTEPRLEARGREGLPQHGEHACDGQAARGGEGAAVCARAPPAALHPLYRHSHALRSVTVSRAPAQPPRAPPRPPAPTAGRRSSPRAPRRRQRRCSRGPRRAAGRAAHRGDAATAVRARAAVPDVAAIARSAARLGAKALGTPLTLKEVNRGASGSRKSSTNKAAGGKPCCSRVHLHSDARAPTSNRCVTGGLCKHMHQLNTPGGKTMTAEWLLRRTRARM